MTVLAVINLPFMHAYEVANSQWPWILSLCQESNCMCPASLRMVRMLTHSTTLTLYWNYSSLRIAILNTHFVLKLFIIMNCNTQHLLCIEIIHYELQYSTLTLYWNYSSLIMNCKAQWYINIPCSWYTNASDARSS